MNPITLPMAELKPALAGFGKIIGKRSTLPVLSHVRLERTKTGRIELAATDLDCCGVVQLDAAEQGEPTAFLVPYDELNNVAKSCGRDDALLVTIGEDQRVALRFPVGGTFLEHRCETLPVEEFPLPAELSGTPILLDAHLRQSIHEAIECASTDETRQILNGAYLDVSKPKAHYVVGTDGRHLFSSNSFALPLAESLIIPSHRFLAWKEFNADGDWRLRVGKPAKDQGAPFELASDHWRFSTRSFVGNYPNWRAVQPSAGSVQTTIDVDAEQVDDIVRTLARMPTHDPINHAIGVEVKDAKVALLGRSSRTDDWTRLEIPGLRARGPDVRIHLNRLLITKAVRFGLLRLEIIDALSPVRFSAGGRQMIVMPIRGDSTPPPPPPPGSTPAAGHLNSPPAASTAAESRKETPMPEENGTTATSAKRAADTNSSTAKPALEAALAQIDTIKSHHREALRGLTELADALKQAQREQKAGEREIQSVRATLRSLQSVRI